MSAPVKQRRQARRIFKGLTVFATFGVLGVVALFMSLWLEHRTAVTLPTPTGPFAVGRILYDWTDPETLDTLAPVPGSRRELLVWIWYPADAPSSAVDDYLPATTRSAIEQSRGALLSKFLTRDLSKVNAHSLRNAAVSPQQSSYPVAIMRAGASLEVANYSTLAEDLASQGYVVVGIDAPYRTAVVAFPDGRVIQRTPENNPELCMERLGQEQAQCVNKLMTAWTADIGFVLDRLKQLNASDPLRTFKGRFDMARVGVFGHSFGGAQAALFCSQDSRCKAGIDIDGAPFGSVLQEGIHKPFMFLLSGRGDFSSEVEVRQILANIQSIYGRLPADARFLIVIRGANHFTFSDDGALLKCRIFRGALHIFGKLGIHGRRQLAVTSYCVRSFFDAYLKGSSVSPPKISSPLYPEIQFLE